MPDDILLYPGPLSDESWAVMRLHPRMGVKILDSLQLASNLKNLIESHHERYDGSGYPNRLKGDEIPLGARIISIVDALDAMATRRRYRPELPGEYIIGEIEKNSGSQFDPMASKAMLDMIDRGEIGLRKWKKPDGPLAAAI